jgi:rSAM/selenodomain-associated transferase 2
VIIPVLNEAPIAVSALQALQPLRVAGHELVLVDGGSRDETVMLGRPLVDRLEVSAPGRARQMNAGAAVASGAVFWFLHLDTEVFPGAGGQIFDRLQASGKDWGRFDVRLSGRHPLLRVVERLMNLRSRVSGIATGDQGIFVRRELFRNLGGYPEIPLMEDIALCRHLKRVGSPLCLRNRLITSSRRWERDGVLRTILLMWRLRLAYALGADPARLAEDYASPAPHKYR